MPHTKHIKGIILSYIIAQFSSIVIYPLFLFAFSDQSDFLLVSTSTTISFVIGLVLMSWVIRNEWHQLLQTTFLHSFSYSMVGFIIAIAGQVMFSILISSFNNGELNQETEQYMLEMSKESILFLAVPILIGPILEEFVFRYAILGNLMKRMKTSYAVLLSSLLFGLLHFNLINIIIYVFCGIVFSVIYIKTKSIITPILAHVYMNAFVMAMFLLG
ncbi:CPBP family intramembrane glutamic endopeptidase [Virgibacillus halodenitrificans]|uniref:CPBP family intramembrane glutamic endopeptidase n=1 Tax=Virgibacillus halodenitrificans TaxID=1482 RepID=UPI000EF50D18|nr:type II CAAX endopeptidase family protein [Virgibacillus halodenitrificans]